MREAERGGQQELLVPFAAQPGEVVPELTAEQRAAIEARSIDVFTEAGAGTGKTGVLVERYCDAVTEDGVAPERILAFTFTERAAGELRERIRAELIRRARAAAGAGDAELAAAIARAARDGERAWITTMHGFCRRLLAAHPVAASMDPRFRVLDEAEAARLGERAFAEALDEVIAARGGSVARFAAGFAPRRLRDVVRAAHERLRSQGVDPPLLPDPGPPVRSVKEEGEAPELSASEAALASEGLAALGELLVAYDRRYERLKAERAGADFEDLQLRALRLLRAPGPVRAAWRGRFEHLMVDEFQDTNGVQLALVDALRGPATRLFVVGDEFQSIYRFRHADLHVFRRWREESRADPEVEERPLRGNFRSRPEVLGAVNFAGGALLGDFVSLEAARKADGEPIGGGPAVELLLTDASGDRAGGGWAAEGIGLETPEQEASPAYVAEARFLAARLRELADAGVPRGDMVVLLRAFTHVDAYEEALDRFGLAPYVVGGRGYWSQQQVEDTLRLLGAVANPLDDEHLFGALASPACGVSPDALWLLRRTARTSEGRPLHVWPTLERSEWPEDMPPADARRLEGFRDILAGLRREAPLLPLDSLIDRAISAFDYDLAALSRRGGERRMANIRKLMRLAREYEEHDGRDLRGFLDFAEERTVRDEREGMAAVQVEGHDGVRLMTVHAAKGLQFPVVAVADLGRGLGVGGRPGDLVIGRIEEAAGTTHDCGAGGDRPRARFGMRLPIAAAESLRLWELVELCEEERATEIEEACRLVYVGVSRAEDRLILSGIFRPSDLEASGPVKASHSALKLLLPALGERGWSGGNGEAELHPPAPIGGAGAAATRPTIAVRIQAPSAERAAELRRRVPWPGEPTDGDRDGAPSDQQALLERRRPPEAVGHLSYSALADYSGCGYRFYVERVIGLRSPASLEESREGEVVRDPAHPTPEMDELVDPALGARERSIAIGSAVHAALERSARRSWECPDDAELRALLGRQGVTEDRAALERLRALVRGWLGSPLRAQLEVARARLRPEVPFLLGLAGTVIRGKIDLLAETADGPLVVDYKTDALNGGDPADLAARYRTQRDLYALAVHHARERGAGAEDSDSRIRAAHCFLEAPDRPLIETYDSGRLARARRRMERLVESIRAGGFERTDTPHPALCHGCPAAAHLCGRPGWRPASAPSQPG
jgi:ATP-dependent exoDNAse (exonuclease V) beta subunit